MPNDIVDNMFVAVRFQSLDTLSQRILLLHVNVVTRNTITFIEAGCSGATVNINYIFYAIFWESSGCCHVQ